MKITRSLLAALPWMALFAAVVCWHIYLEASGRRSFFFNSDMLTIETLYRDVAAGNDLSQWRLSGAPSFVPDMVFYFGIRSVISSVPVAVLLYGFASFSCMTAGWLMLAMLCGAERAGNVARGTAVAIALGLTAGFAGAWNPDILKCLLANTTHSGVLVLLPWVLWLALRICGVGGMSTATRRIRHGVLLFMLVAAGFASDKLFLPQVILPVVAVFAWLAFRRHASWRAAAVGIAVLVVATVFGQILFRVLCRYPVLDRYVHAGMPSLQLLSMYGRWARMTLMQDTVHVLVVILFALVAAGVLYRSIRAQTRFPSGDVIMPESVAVFFLVSAAANFAALVFGGMNEFVAFALPVLWGAPFLAQAFGPVRTWLEGERAARHIACAAVATLVLLLPWLKDARLLARYADYYPEPIRCLDAELARRGLHDGIADYWEAKHITCLAKHDLHIAQVTPALNTFFWVCNWASYRIRPDFVILNVDDEDNAKRLRQRDITSQFGPAAELFNCGNLRVLVYNRPQDAAFQSLFANLGAPIP